MPQKSSLLRHLGWLPAVLGTLLLVSGLWPIADFRTAPDAPASVGIALSLAFRPYLLGFGGTLLLFGIVLLCWHRLRHGPVA